jgi:hypothetical protein
VKIRLDRAAQIRKICAERGIKTLVHFTRIENLRRILEEGLLGRSLLETRGKPFLFNASERVDGHKEAVCVSISFPNYQMFSMYRKRSNDRRWVVLLLDAKVLWELECAFCQENAAHHIPLEERKKPDALKGMFVEDFHAISRQVLRIPGNYPTHPQAEVLVFDSVPVQYIDAVHFWNGSALSGWSSSNSGTYSQTFSADLQYFRPRCDLGVW